MDFEFDDAQELLRATVRRFLAERAPITPYVRAHLDSDPGTSPDVWRGLADLGATGMLVPAEHGGSGRGLVDLAVVLEELGRHVHPGPFASTAVAAADLLTGALATGGGTAAGDADAVTALGAIARGDLLAAAALPLSADPRRATEVVAGADGRLTGTIAAVADAAAAAVLVVVARAGATGDVGVYLVDPTATGVTVTPLETVDPTRRHATVELAAAPAARVGGSDASTAVDASRDRVLTAAVVDGVGVAEQAMTLAVAYAKERRQFGRPIGSFQAVQHLCAEMLQAVELGRSAAYYASWACDAADPAERRRATTMAVAYGGPAFARVGASAIQVFGGVGCTWEHDVHLFYKRLLTLEQLGGPPRRHLDDLAGILLA